MFYQRSEAHRPRARHQQSHLCEVKGPYRCTSPEGYFPEDCCWPLPGQHNSPFCLCPCMTLSLLFFHVCSHLIRTQVSSRTPSDCVLTSQTYLRSSYFMSCIAEATVGMDWGKTSVPLPSFPPCSSTARTGSLIKLSRQHKFQ